MFQYLITEYGPLIGPLPLYAALIVAFSLAVDRFWHLFGYLALSTAVCLAILKSLKLEDQFGTSFVAKSFSVSQETGNTIAVIAFIFVTGIGTHAVRRFWFGYYWPAITKHHADREHSGSGLE